MPSSSNFFSHANIAINCRSSHFSSNTFHKQTNRTENSYQGTCSISLHRSKHSSSQHEHLKPTILSRLLSPMITIDHLRFGFPGGGGLLWFGLNIGAFLNISGIWKNLTCEPLMNTWSKCDVLPSLAVTVISFNWIFMLSSDSSNLPRYISPLLSSTETIWP